MASSAWLDGQDTRRKVDNKLLLATIGGLMSGRQTYEFLVEGRGVTLNLRSSRSSLHSGSMGSERC